MWARSVLLGILLACAAPASLLAQSDLLLRRGIERMQQGKFKEALDDFDRVKQQQPEDPRAYFYSGHALLRTEQAIQALSQMEKAVEMAPDRLQYLLAYGELLVQLGYKFRALSAMEAFLERPAATAGLGEEERWFLSDLLFRLGMNQEALALLQDYEPSTVELEKVLFRRAQLHMALDDLEAALGEFQQAKERTDRQAEALYGIGLVLFRQGNVEEARRSLEECVTLAPSNAEYVHLLATILNNLGEPENALLLLERVEAQAESHPKILDAIARSYRLMRNREKADEYTRRFTALDSESRELQAEGQKAHTLLQDAQRLFDAKKFAEAEKRFQEVLEADPDNFMAHSYLAVIYIERTYWSLAERHISSLQKLKPEAFETHYLSALFYHRRGNLSEALRHGLQAREIQPSFADLRNLLGNIYYSLGERQNALSEYQAATRLDPDREEFRMNYEALARREN